MVSHAVQNILQYFSRIRDLLKLLRKLFLVETFIYLGPNIYLSTPVHIFEEA